MSNNKKSKKKKIIIFSIIGILLIAVVVAVVVGSNKETVISVQVEKVQKRTITQSVTATGKVFPEVQVVISPEVSGEIIYLPVKDGQKVKKNEVLLKIKPDIYNARRDQMTAGVTSSSATLQRAESDYRRVKDLFNKKLVSDAELEQSKTTYEVSKAQHEQSQAALNQATEDLRKTTIYAPMDGTVSQLKVELGERVLGTSQFQGTAVMTVADLSRMECRIDVGENDIVTIKIGDTTRINIDAFPNKKFIGTVYEIANAATTKGLGTQEEVTNFQVKIRIIDKDVPLRPGMSVTATVETQRHENVLSVPIQCVTTRMPKIEKPEKPEGGEGVTIVSMEKKKQKTENEAKEVVFLYDDGKAKMLEVKRGISDDSYIEILGGLKEDQTVITGSFKAISRDLEDGKKVKLEKTIKKIEKK
jgi:HlyD family secretion protein